MGILDKLFTAYFAGQNEPDKVLVREWYYPFIVIAFWISMIPTYVGGFLMIIIYVTRGDVELPPDRGSQISFWFLAAIYILVLSALVVYSISKCLN